MSAAHDTTQRATLPSAPFVGLRPFERGEQQIFLGRDRDAALLRDKVFAARLTILYGPSGIGKSSILRALLVPRLEEEHARCVYFDTWRGDDPLAMLKARLVLAAASVGIPNAGGGAPSLLELARLVNSADGKTVVLVLDQFEEFFAAHSQRIESLRGELGQLVRAAGADVRVLLSLREEHLAALEPFRDQMLDLFQSTYRLEALVQASVREAIIKPIERFSGTIEPALVDALIKDVGQGEAAAGGEQASAVVAYADLPILQLLCFELWQEAGVPDGRPALTQSLYTRLGGRLGILDGYLRRVTPQRWRDKRVTAELMRHLAPPDGHKVSFSVEHLTSLTELPSPRVKAELERMSERKVQILRTRAYGTDKVLYELWHDSFIRIIGPWRDRVLRDARKLKYLGQASGIAFLVMLVTIVVLRVADRYELQRNTQGVLHSVDRTAAQKLDDLASYLLWNRSGSARLEVLRQLLREHAAMMPQDYGVNVSGIEFATLLSAYDEWPLVLEYSSRRKLDEFAFAQAWKTYAQSVNETWGIPVPLQLRLEKVATHPKQFLRLRGRQIEPLELDLETDEDLAYFSSKDLRGPPQEFLERFRDDWTRIDWLEQNGPWWKVPRWSLPAWKVSGVTASDGSGLPALRLSNLLLEQPERLLTPAVVDFMLGRVARHRPATVAEARAVRGGRLPRDLQEIVKNGHPLVHLPQILDALAAMPDASSAQVAQAIILGADSARPAPAAELRGPHAATQPLRPGDTAALGVGHQAYKDAEQWLPYEPEIRVYVGQTLRAAWLTESNQWKSEPLTRFDGLRDDLLRRYGILMPNVSRWRSTSEPPRDGFRIELLDLDSTRPHLVEASTSAPDGLDRLLGGLASGAVAYRLHFISADSVAKQLDALNSSALKGWLRSRYSITDIKLLLRAVVDSPAGAPPKALDQEPPEFTARHTEWLLASLVFWKQVEARRRVSSVGERLRATQRARLRQPAAPAADHPATALVQDGARVLGLGLLSEAEQKFAQAVAADKAVAVDAFLYWYPSQLLSQQVRKLHASCEDYRQPKFERFEKVDFEDLARGKELDETTQPAIARKLRLCLLASNPGRDPEERRRLAQTIAESYGPPKRWPAEEAAWFGETLLKNFDPTSDKPILAEIGGRFLKTAMPALSSGEALKQFDRIARICEKPGPTRWCWRLLPQVAEASAGPAVLALLAAVLSNREVGEDLEQALSAARKAKSRLVVGALPKAAIQGWLDGMDYTIASARMRLANPLQTEVLDEVSRDFIALLKSSGYGAAAHAGLAELQSQRGRADEAAKVVETGLKTWPRSPMLLSTRLKLAFSDGDRSRASETAKLARELASNIEAPGAADYAFVASLGLLMTKTGPWELAGRKFLATNHPYVPYIALLLHSRMAGAGVAKKEAQDLLEERWREVRPRTWKGRLLEGDEAVWREMLIGYSMGSKAVPRDMIFGELEDERRFAQSDLRHLPLPRLGMLCEAHLYDALLAEAANDPPRMRRSLERSVATGYTQYYEHAMAKFLLSQTP